MQNNLATEIIRDLKRKIRILIAVIVILCLALISCNLYYTIEFSHAGEIDQESCYQSEMCIPGKVDGKSFIMKRRVKGGKI